MKIDNFLYELRILDNAEESILRKMDSGGPRVEGELREGLRQVGLQKVVLCHQFGLQYPCQYGKIGGLVEIDEDSKTAPCRLHQMDLEEMIDDLERDSNNVKDNHN